MLREKRTILSVFFTQIKFLVHIPHLRRGNWKLRNSLSLILKYRIIDTNHITPFKELELKVFRIFETKLKILGKLIELMQCYIPFIKMVIEFISCNPSGCIAPVPQMSVWANLGILDLTNTLLFVTLATKFAYL